MNYWRNGKFIILSILIDRYGIFLYLGLFKCLSIIFIDFPVDLFLDFDILIAIVGLILCTLILK